MKLNLWWWAVLVAIVVLVGWLTGSLGTGAAAAEDFGLAVTGLFLAGMIISGFVQLRRGSSGVPIEDAPTLRPQATPLRNILVTVALFALSTLLAIHEASSGADWLAFAIAVLGMVLFGGRLLVVLLRMGWRKSSAP